MSTIPLFTPFPKMPRLLRQCIITEKIDGTNAQVYISEDGDILFGSRNRWITPENDNYGFAKWGVAHKDELLKLGPGKHFGEWWGNGIQRGYGLKEKRFSLFNAERWCPYGGNPKELGESDGSMVVQEVLPECIGVVPWMYNGEFDTNVAIAMVELLRHGGSIAAPSWKQPEGIVVYHKAANIGFKMTLENDDKPKGKV